MKTYIQKVIIRTAVAALLISTGLIARAQVAVYSDDFNRASLGGSYTVSATATAGAGGGTAYIVGGTTLWLTNGSPAGWVSVATNIPNGSFFNATLDSCTGPVTWSFNMRFGRTGGLPGGFSSGSYGVGYVLAADGADFAVLGTKGYAILLGNGGSPDAFRLVAFTNGIRTDYNVAGTSPGNTLIAGTGAFSVASQGAANEYYSFQVTYDPATQTWTFSGRDDGSTSFADPSTGSFTLIGTFTETTPIFRTTALGRTGAYWSHSTGANNPSQFDNFKLSVTPAGTSVAIDNTGAPAAGTVIIGNNDVPVFGFRLSPTGGSTDFTALKVTTAGTATSSDLNNFRVVFDADDSGTYNGGDIIVSTSAQSLANPMNFGITGQTGFSSARRYLVIANVVGGATHTFTGSLASPGDVTTTGFTSGTALGSQQTIATAVFDMTMAAEVSSESATLSSLITNATITTTSQGAQVWQVTFSNPGGAAGVGVITAINFTQGLNNGVANWQNAIQAAELFDGTTPVGAGTISANGIAFSGLNVSVTDGNSKTLSLRISFKSTPGALADNAHLEFALAPGDVTVTGNGVTTASIDSDESLNAISVVATRLVFTSVPVSVVTNATFFATVKAEDANGNVDVDDATAVTLSLASGSGILTGGDALNLLSGSNRWTILIYDTPGVFSLQAAGGSLANGTSANIIATLLPTLTEVIMPQYMQGIASGSSNGKRVPFAYRVTFSNLLANATYRYFNQAVNSGDSATSSGAGNSIFVTSSGNFGHTSGPSLGSVGNYSSFVTDANGSFTGWFVLEATGNTRFGAAGNQVYMRIMLNDGAEGTSVVTRLTTPDFATVLPFATSGGNTGSGIYGNSFATDKNFVLLYDNIAGTGRPLTATFVENDGVAENTATSFVKFYNDFVDGVSGAWGAIVPNDNVNGVQRIEQRSLADGSLVASDTDADGVWPSGANTVNPTGGDATPIVITSTDAPLGGAAPTTPVVTGIQIVAGNVLIDFTGGAADTIANFTVLSSASLSTALTPVGATITTSGPGVFRASIPVSTPAAFYRIQR